MLQVAFIKDNKEKVLAGLKKRNFSKLELIDEILSLDESRKKIQFDLDSQLSEMNKISKDIGILIKDGKKDEAEQAKSMTLSLKESTKKLQQNLSDTEEKLKFVLYEVPNIPNDLVPAGINEEDNLEVFRHSANENIYNNALTHFDINKK